MPYKLRKITQEDRDELQRWIAADPDHCGRVSPDFFLPPKPTATQPKDSLQREYMLCSDAGGHLFYARIERCLRVHIQFNPAADRRRNMRGLEDGLEWLAQAARKSGLCELIFESGAMLLRRFCEKRLGFKVSPNELVLGIVQDGAEQAQGKPVPSEQP